jgi:hypothetical protein
MNQGSKSLYARAMSVGLDEAATAVRTRGARGTDEVHTKFE